MRLFGGAPSPAPGARWSSGWPSLDAALGGGFDAGRPVLLRSERGESFEGFRRFTTPLAREVLLRSGGVLVVLRRAEPPDRPMREILGRDPPYDDRDRLRIVDYGADEPAGPWHVPLGRGVGRDRGLRRMVEAERRLREGGGTMLELDDWETRVTLHGPELAGRMAGHGVPRAREIGNLMITWAGTEAVPDPVAALYEVELSLGHDAGRPTITGRRPSFLATALAAPRA